jgi:hypothetical protein
MTVMLKILKIIGLIKKGLMNIGNYPDISLSGFLLLQNPYCGPGPCIDCCRDVCISCSFFITLSS